ncbi:MAG: hypothetical protein ABIA21_01185 [Candidatus Aenigmatarchaeota archaeon]
METDRLDWILLILYAIALFFSIYYQLWPIIAVIAALAIVTFVQRVQQEGIVNTIVTKTEKRYIENITSVERKIDSLTKQIITLQKELAKDVNLIDKNLQERQTNMVNYTDFAEKIIDLENKLNKIKTFLEE